MGIVNLAIDDTRLYYSPYNWLGNGGGARQSNNIEAGSTVAVSNCVGSYIKWGADVSVSDVGITLGLLFDDTNYSGLTAGTKPVGELYVDGILNQSAEISTFAGLISNDLTIGHHEFLFVFKSVGVVADYWVTPVLATFFGGIYYDNATTTITASRKIWPSTAIFYGDSYVAGFDACGKALANADNHARKSWPNIVAEALHCEYGIIAFGGQGYTKGIGFAPASSSAPSFKNTTSLSESWNRHYAGKTRSFSVAPTYVFICFGINDAGSINSTIVTQAVDAVRTAVGVNTWIFVCLDFGGGFTSAATSITNGVAAASSTTKSKAIVSGITRRITPGVASAYSYDSAPPVSSSHPNFVGHMDYANQILAAIQSFVTLPTSRLAVVSRAAVSRGSAGTRTIVSRTIP